MRDRTRRALLVLVTDGRATAGPEALGRARAIAAARSRTGVQAVVVDGETGRFRMGLAADIAARMGADYLPLGELREGALVEAVTQARAGTSAIQTPRSVA